MKPPVLPGITSKRPIEDYHIRKFRLRSIERKQVETVRPSRVAASCKLPLVNSNFLSFLF